MRDTMSITTREREMEGHANNKSEDFAVMDSKGVTLKC